MIDADLVVDIKTKRTKNVPRPYKAKKRPARIVKGNWPDERIRKLISCVQSRPGLWNSRSQDYRSPKPHAWQGVAAELGNKNDWSDCRAKWQTLRVTYKTNFAKSLKNSSGLETDENNRVHWRFYNAMRFIEKNDSELTTDSISNFNLNDDSALSQQTEDMEQNSAYATVSSPSPAYNDQRSMHFSASSLVEPTSLIDNSQIVRQLMAQSGERDRYSVFGEHVAAELRSLSTDEGHLLQRRISRAMLEFFDERDVSWTSVPHKVERN